MAEKDKQDKGQQVKEEFLYKGKPIYELERLTNIPQEKQLQEIENRFIALREHYFKTNTPLTAVHFYNVLRIGKTTWQNWLNARRKFSGKSVHIIGTDSDSKAVAFVTARAALLQDWLSYAEQWTMDGMANDPVPTRRMFVLNNNFGYQSKNDRRGLVNAESINERANEILARKRAEKKEAK